MSGNFVDRLGHCAIVLHVVYVVMQGYMLGECSLLCLNDRWIACVCCYQHSCEHICLFIQGDFPNGVLYFSHHKAHFPPQNRGVESLCVLWSEENIIFSCFLLLKNWCVLCSEKYGTCQISLLTFLFPGMFPYFLLLIIP